MTPVAMTLDSRTIDPPTTEEPSDLADAWLVRSLRHGDVDAFKTLYDRSHRKLYGLAYRLTASPADAEELTQEVFARAWNHRTEFRNVRHFERWLRRVAINTFISGVRRDVPEAGLDGDAPERLEQPGSGRDGGSRLRIDLERALATLSPRLRAVLVLFDLYGLRHEEIAEHLAITVGGSKVQLHRARKRLREILR